MNHALIESASGRVVDLFAGVLSDLYEPPAEHVLVEAASGAAHIGDLYSAKTGTFSPLAYEGLSLDALKDSLKRAVDLKAERVRQTLITPGSGQAMEYQESYAQAKAALAQDAAHTADATKPAVSDADPAYVLLAATIGIDIDPSTGKPAADVLGVARSVKMAYEAYLAAGAAIKEARLKGKAAIEAAASADAAADAFSAIIWPSFG